MKKRSFWAANKLTLYIRIMAGGYIAYLGYQVFRDREEITSNYYVLMAFSIAFMLIGAFLVVMSAKMLINKEYEEARTDMEEDKSIETAASLDESKGEANEGNEGKEE